MASGTPGSPVLVSGRRTAAFAAAAPAAPAAARQGRKLLRVFSVARLPGKGMDRHADLQELRSTTKASGRANHSWLVRETKQVLALTCSFTWWQVQEGCQFPADDKGKGKEMSLPAVLNV
jgi:hypothetical protein